MISDEESEANKKQRLPNDERQEGFFLFVLSDSGSPMSSSRALDRRDMSWNTSGFIHVKSVEARSPSVDFKW
ncbi:hypothetical protein TNCV_998031 [Trichonephila clavipes]|nr:hypothetical protein TNCV_998031 [Trichonephila clavipes]